MYWSERGILRRGQSCDGCGIEGIGVLGVWGVSVEKKRGFRGFRERVGTIRTLNGSVDNSNLLYYFVPSCAIVWRRVRSGFWGLS